MTKALKTESELVGLILDCLRGNEDAQAIVGVKIRALHSDATGANWSASPVPAVSGDALRTFINCYAPIRNQFDLLTDA